MGTINKPFGISRSGGWLSHGMLWVWWMKPFWKNKCNCADFFKKLQLGIQKAVHVGKTNEINSKSVKWKAPSHWYLLLGVDAAVVDDDSWRWTWGWWWWFEGDDDDGGGGDAGDGGDHQFCFWSWWSLWWSHSMSTCAVNEYEGPMHKASKRGNSQHYQADLTMNYLPNIRFHHYHASFWINEASA